MRGSTHIEPLSQNRLFQTSDLDEARAIVAGKFCDHRLDINAHKDRFDACHHRADGAVASLNYLRYGADVRIEPGELGSFYLIQIPLSGTAEIDNNGGAIQTFAGQGSVLNPHRDTKMHWRDGCAQLLLQVDRSAVTDEAQRLLGAPVHGPVTFETSVDEQRAATADWVRKLKTCFGLAERKAIFGSKITNTQTRIERELIADFLRSQPSNISAQIASAPSTTANMHVRRAVHFIRSNLHRTVVLSDIAGASGTTPRSLQMYFQAEFGLSPMRYLRQQRLILARTLIQQSTGQDLLGDIAFRAGFTHLGRFSADYRAHFGEAPSETKRQCNLRV